MGTESIEASFLSIFALISFFKDQTGAENLVMAGGCSLNGVFNAK